MRDRLFEMGVFDDDDAPARKSGPVQNVDEEPLRWQHNCPGCNCLLVDSMLSGLCKDCHQRHMERKRYAETKREEREKARQQVAGIVGNLCIHCGIRRRKYLSRVCGQRACERHE
jgi:hypothetical protein